MKNIWLVTVGEPSPVDNDIRLHRTGLLANSLSDYGYSVTLFNSTFSHQEKKQRYKKTKIINHKENLKLVFLFGRPYMKNISLNRVFSNNDNSVNFSEISNNFPKPDLVICAFPILGLVKEVTNFCEENNVPWILDIRDFWPDVFLEIVPRILRPIASLIFLKFLFELKSSIKKADFIISPFDGTKNWLNTQFKKDNFIKKYQTIPFTYPAPNPNSSVDSKVSAIIDRGADIIITFAGNISEFSNIEDLFEIERVAKYKNLNFQIIVCGSGPKYEYFANKSKSQKSDIVFTGLLDQPSLSYILSNSDYGFLGYNAQHLIKGVPNKVIEYTCHGLPIIINSAMEICSDSDFGVILEPYFNKEINGLLDRVSRGSSNNDKKRIRFFYENNFSENVIFKKYLDLIQRLSVS